MTSIEALHGAFLRSAGACTDTRQLLAEGLFFALRGPNFNANGFAAKALEGGCAFAVVDDPAVVADERFLLVPDVLGALQELGRYHRRRFKIPIVAITGTNGKTTSKELVHAVLSADRSTLATGGNLNNHIGVPLTLLRLMDEHRIAIIEMGANHVGDIDQLVRMAEPTHGVITNIGRAHLEGFGSYEGVIVAKTEMYGHLRTHHGVVFVNADDPLLMEKSEGMDRRTYGRSETADLRVEDRSTAASMAIAWRGRDGRAYQAATRLVGGYNLPNAALAVAIGHHFEVPDERIAEALIGYVPANNRSQFIDTGRNQLIMDAYNANPSSMVAALENFAALSSERPKLALLGGMKELGPYEAREHQLVVDKAHALGVEAMLIGPEFAGVDAGGFQVFRTADEALAVLRNVPVVGHTVLLKGSRGTKLEILQPAL